MKYHWLLPLVSAGLNAILGGVVIARNRRARLNQVFLLMSLAVALWNLNNFVFYAIHDPTRALWWGKIFRTGTILMPSTLLHLILCLVDISPAVAAWLLGGSYGLSAVLLVANFSGLLVVDVRQHEWGLYPVGTRLYAVYLGAVIFQCLLALGLLVREYLTTTSKWRKLQARFWLLGSAVAIPMGLGNFLPMYGVPVYPTGHLGTVIYAGIIAYAIARHRLMDIDLVITKGMAYTAVALALIAPAFGLALWLQELSFGQIHPDFSFALLLMLVAVGVLFPTLRTRAETRIERSLFGEKHRYRETLDTFARSIVRILDRDKLLRELTETLSSTLKLDRVAIVLLKEDENVYRVTHSTGVPSVVSEFFANDALVETLARHGEILVRDELASPNGPGEPKGVADVFSSNGWELCIPFTINDRLMGFAGLGNKRNLETFYAEDIDLLATVAAEVAIALENARLYGELKKSRDIIERTGRLSALGTLAAGIAHEIRNPLVSIHTFFQLAPKRLNDKQFFTEFLSLSAAEVLRINNLITELLTFAKSPSHSTENVNINDVIERTVLLLIPEARKHRVDLSYVLAEGIPYIRADADQIKQVIINIVLNAIQATRPGGAVTLTTRSMTRHDGLFCQTEVRDTGCGIPEKLIEDIFNPFFTTKGKGTGLGLSVAHQIAAEHGGFIAVSSEEGRGSVFCINLPAAPSTDAAPVSPPTFESMAGVEDHDQTG